MEMTHGTTEASVRSVISRMTAKGVIQRKDKYKIALSERAQKVSASLVEAEVEEVAASSISNATGATQAHLGSVDPLS